MQSAYLVAEKCVSRFDPITQIFYFEDRSGFCCVPIPDLADYFPLYVYKHNTKPCVLLKHGVMMWSQSQKEQFFFVVRSF